jgi:hypothetical protein
VSKKLQRFSKRVKNYVKWRVPDFIHLKAPRSNVYCGSWQSTNKMTIPWIATDSSLNLRADFWTGRMYCLLHERGAWQSAVHLRAVCQGVIPVVANCAELSKWVNSSTRHFTSTDPLFLASYLFDARLYKLKNYICGRLFRPKLYFNGLSLSHHLFTLSLFNFEILHDSKLTKKRNTLRKE